ncbi:type II toxin-antitoxin system Phd/YefM family antitoxin [Chitinophaga tropicalis]|uniref:Antitoxin n=1 Tax=Chitinophaga tropicalis TaxID=2683588 RepID=A0A7K1U663_9BACT|nr:type II toxin-antitoxin system Phd/YefM family antitoxin [Chitinophaga tropicalis]MVT09776.1 type II toxin-antitoxin system prevent-host-death family antitoxin [Chitinophaga tropicalis]
MQVVTYSEFRKGLKSHLDDVTQNNETLIVPRGKSEDSVVVISLNDYNAMMETLHLMKSTKNRERLFDALKRADADEYESHELSND